MIRCTIKQLFRRSLLVTVVSLLSACASFKTDSLPAPVIDLNEQDVVSIKPSVALPLSTSIPTGPVEAEVKAPEPSFVLEIPQKEDNFTENIVSRYKMDFSVISNIVNLAERLEYDDFPKRKDILAIIAIESSYKARAFLHGCKGLMQVEQKSHRDKTRGRNLFSPEVNIEVGAKILHEYYTLLGGNKRGAILAYNAGIGNYLKGRYRIAYFKKYSKQMALLSQN